MSPADPDRDRASDVRILDANLKALLQRAYQAAEPRPAFAAQLTQQVVARAEDLARKRDAAFHAPSSTAVVGHRSRVVWLCAAALFLATAAVAIALWSRNAATPLILDEILQRGRVAVRFDRNADWDERSAEDARLGLIFVPPRMEVATPASGNALVITDAGRLVLQANTHAALMRGTNVEGSAAEFVLQLDHGTAIWTGFESTTFRTPGRYELRNAAQANASRVKRSAQPDAADRTSSSSDANPSQSAAEDLTLLHFQVIDAETRLPLSTCEVTVADLQRRDEVRPRTQRFEDLIDGQGSIQAPASPRLSLRVRSDAYASLRRDFSWPPAAEKAGQRIELALERGSSIRGRVVDATSGAPIANALVFSETDAPAAQISAHVSQVPTSLRTTRSDADGNFHLEHLSTGRQVLRAMHDEYAASWTAPIEFTPWEPLAEITIALDRGGVIEGVVRRADGTPFGMSFVIASLFDFNGEHPCGLFLPATSQGDGRFELSRLPAGNYLLMHFAGLPTGAAAEARDYVQVRVDSNAVTHVTLGGAPDPRALHGVLLDHTDQPIGGAMLTFVEGEGDIDQGWPMSMCDAEGKFALSDAQAGSFRVYNTRDKGHSLVYCGTLQHDPDRSIAHTLRWSEMGFRGRVRLGDDQPREGALLVVEERLPDGSRAFAGKTSTDRDGHYLLRGLPPGEYRVTAHALVEGHGQESSSWTKLLPDETRELDFKLWPGGTLRIEVVNEAGAPIDAASVNLRNPEGSAVSFAPFQQTDARGVFVARGCAPGKWTVTASKSGYQPSSVQPVEVRIAEPAQVRLVLSTR